MNNNLDKQPIFINRSNFELTVQRNLNLVNVNREVLEMNRGRWGTCEQRTGVGSSVWDRVSLM